MTERRDRIRVHLEGKEYSVVGGDFQDMLAAIKQIVGRRFVSELKVWQLPGTAEEVQHQLAISGYELEGGKPVAAEAAASPAGVSGDRIRIRVGEHSLAVVGGTFQEMLEAVKGLPGRRFDGNAKIWEIVGDVGVIQGMIETAGFQLEGAEALSLDPAPPMEPPNFAATSQKPPPPPSLEEPGFMATDFDEEDLQPSEPPDWWDNDMPPPILPEDLDDLPSSPPFMEETNPFAGTPPSRASAFPTEQGSGDRIRIRLGDIPLVVTGGSFQEMLAAVKNIPGRRFNGQDKIWEIPEDVTFDSINQALSAAGFTVMPG